MPETDDGYPGSYIEGYYERVKMRGHDSVPSRRDDVLADIAERQASEGGMSASEDAMPEDLCNDSCTSDPKLCAECPYFDWLAAVPGPCRETDGDCERCRHYDTDRCPDLAEQPFGEMQPIINAAEAGGDYPPIDAFDRYGDHGELL